MALEEYQRKRDFTRTPEPTGQQRPYTHKDAHSFVVQKHDATRLHYDLRLELDGVLVSWAVPEGPSLDPAHKRLAVHVEDHPLEYGRFEGVIPSGYGAGTVMLWDRGVWEPEGDAAAGLKRGKLSFRLEGERLRGMWTLTKIRSSRKGDDGRDNWLLIKHDDEHADAGDEPLAAFNRSVESGRSMEQIADEAAGPGVLAGSRRGAPTAKPKTRKRRQTPAKSHADNGNSVAAGPDPAGVVGASPAAFPESVSPQLCTLADRAPDGDGWVHEIKFDGYRLLALRSEHAMRLVSRNEKDWTDRFKPIVRAVDALPAKTCILDGEACVLDTRGHTSFQALQQAIKDSKFDRLAFFAFDLLYLDGHDLTAAPLLERKALLRALLAAQSSQDSEEVLRYSDHVRGHGGAVHTNACELALEGIIAKKADAPYTQARSRTWLKVKCSRRQEFVVIGYTPPSGSRKHFGSLLLGAYDGDGRLIYTGKVGTGFSDALLRDLKARLDALERKTCPADEPPAPAERRDATWVSPKLVAEIEFTEWTDDGRLRHPSFQGLRQDKPAADVRVEHAEPVAAAAAGAEAEQAEAPSNRAEPAPADPKPKASRRAATPARASPAAAAAKAAPEAPKPRRGQSADPTVAGVRISSPGRVLFPDAGVTKLELAEYYHAVADRLLPFISGRPLSTVRCPQGRSGKCFFQKHLGTTFSEPVRAIRVKEKSGPADYIAIDSVEGLITLVQFGVIEIHPWGAHEDDLDAPDLLTFDLDPGEGVGWEALPLAARRVRDMLSQDGLESFPKLTGGKGLHVVVPLTPKAGWDQAKAYCHAVAERLVKEHPHEYVATVSKAKRRGKVFIDYLRNSRGATSVAAFSARARPHAPVAVPIRWGELSKFDSGAHYTTQTLNRRLAQLRSDPWPGFFRKRQKLPQE